MRTVRALAIIAAILGNTDVAAAEITFTTLAGIASAGSADGTGAAARFWSPSSVAVEDGTGNIYVADTSNHTIRKISSAGVVTTLAGLAGSSGTVDGVGSAARFNSPRGIAVNSSTGVVYVTEASHVIRAVTPAGAVTTLAGLAGTAGSSDGVGTAALFNLPTGITVNSVTGMIYVADTNNNTIRAITAGGVVATLAGLAAVQGTADGIGGAARFRLPQGISVNTATNVVYVADTNNSTIRLVTPSTGQVQTWLGAAGLCGGTDGIGGAARFCAPRGVWVDSVTWTVYVADTSGGTVRRVTPAGAVSTFAGSFSNSLPLCGVDATGTNARFCGVVSVALNSTTGTLYVADQGAHAIRAVTPAAVVSTFAGVLGRGTADGFGSAARFIAPSHVAVNHSTGVIYVADKDNHTIRTISPSGAVSTLAGLAGVMGTSAGMGSVARFNFPRSLAVNQSTGMIYVMDGNSTLRQVTPAGLVTTLAGSPTATGTTDGSGIIARFNLPFGIAVNSANGIIYVADTFNHTIRLVTPGGVVSTWAGLPGSAGSANGVGTAVRFSSPQGIAVDPATWNVYVADTNNQVVRQITPAGVVSTLAGLAGSAGTVDGVGPAARFVSPRAITFGAGLLYVADSSTIRRVTTAGAVTLVGGGVSGSEDGVGPAARFQLAGSGGLALDAAGTLYVADGGNNTIRVGETLAQVQGDFDGDSQTDLALFGSANGRWRLKLSSGSEVTLPWGIPGDLSVPRDYDGDGMTDLSVYRPSNNGWYILQSSSATLLTVLWGIPGDIPVSQDYDGDGRSDIAVYRPTTGEWFIIRSSNSTLLYVAWGIPGDLPIQGDFDGDGQADIGVYRPSSNTWFIIRSTNSTLLQVAWGIPGDVQVPADYDGDNKTDVAVYRPSTGEWFIIRSTNSTLLYVAWGGAVGMQPVPSDFDGDGQADIAVFFPANGTWYIVQSTNSTPRIVTWP